MGLPLTLRSCLACGEVVDARAMDKHQRMHRDAGRASASQRGYGSEWRIIRAEHLLMEPYCADGCGERATEVDHIVPRRQGGTDDHDNLQSLTKAHHSAKTMRESVRR